MAKAKCPIPKTDKKELKAFRFEGLDGACLAAGCGRNYLYREGRSFPGGCLLKQKWQFTPV